MRQRQHAGDRAVLLGQHVMAAMAERGFDDLAPRRRDGRSCRPACAARRHPRPARWHHRAVAAVIAIGRRLRPADDSGCGSRHRVRGAAAPTARRTRGPCGPRRSRAAAGRAVPVMRDEVGVMAEARLPAAVGDARLVGIDLPRVEIEDAGTLLAPVHQREALRNTPIRQQTEIAAAGARPVAAERPHGGHRNLPQRPPSAAGTATRGASGMP